MTPQNSLPDILFSKPIIVIVGGYGSGKSEVSVNLARYLSEHTDKEVAIADLDIVNPYFRSREAEKELSKLGIRSLIPHGDQSHADLPIIIPEIKGAIERHEGWLVLDVGGDDVGAKVLKSLKPSFPVDDYDMFFVHNISRPSTSTVVGTRNMMLEIEHASGLKFAGLISNSHLMDQTTSEIVTDGLAMARKVAKETALDVKFLSATEEVLARLPVENLGCPVLQLDRSLLKPWERK